MSFFAFGNNFNKDGIFAFVDNAQDIAPDIIIKHDCRLHFFMGFHKSFGTLAALFFIAGEDNAELQRQSVFQNVEHRIKRHRRKRLHIQRSAAIHSAVVNFRRKHIIRCGNNVQMPKAENVKVFAVGVTDKQNRRNALFLKDFDFGIGLGKKNFAIFKALHNFGGIAGFGAELDQVGDDVYQIHVFILSGNEILRFIHFI